jgi:hypothetical protein
VTSDVTLAQRRRFYLPHAMVLHRMLKTAPNFVLGS